MNVLRGNSLSLVNDEEVISLSHAKVYVFFRFCVMSWKGASRTQQSNTVWEEQVDVGSKSSPQYRTLDTIDGEPMEFEWNIFPGFTTLELRPVKSKSSLSKHERRTRTIPQDELSSCRCSMTSHGDPKTTNRNAN